MSGIVDFETQIENVEGQKINPATEDSMTVLKAIVRLLKPLSILTGGTNRLSVDIASLPTLGTVTTVSNVTSVNQLSGISSYDLAKATSKIAYNTGVRSKIT